MSNRPAERPMGAQGLRGAQFAAGGVQTTAVVTTAVPLTRDQQATILHRLQTRFGQRLLADFDVDPSLLGGVQARVGDELIDDTVAGRLSALREALIKSGETK